MKKIIHKLRSKSNKEKRQLLHIFTFIGAIILIILWTWSLGASFSNKDTKVKVKQDLKPFSVLKDNIVGGYKGVSNSNSNINQ